MTLVWSELRVCGREVGEGLGEPGDGDKAQYL